MMTRRTSDRGEAGKAEGPKVGVTLAITAMGALATMAGPAVSPARASISQQQRLGWMQSYDIPSGPMAPALNAFAYVNGLHLAYEAQVTQSLRTEGLAGAFSMKEGLDRLLRGTGLGYRFSDKGRSVSIVLAQNDGVRSDAGAEALPPIDVGAEQQQAKPGRGGYGGAGAAQDPYNTTYQLPNASTGTKTDTAVMDTPLNVQSVTQQVLRDQQVITLGEALRNVSGVTVPSGAATFTSNRTSGIFVRGFQASTYYRDGFRVDSSVNLNDLVGSRQLADIASVEVLKGPGAVLYGLVEPGGIINLVTKEPLDAPYYSVQQQIGSLALYRTTIDATGPVTDDKSVLYRMNMSYENNGAPFGSFIDFTHSQNFFVAPVVKWNIDPSTWVKLEAEYSDDHSSIYFPFTPLYDGTAIRGPRSRNYGESSPDHQTTLFSALTWSHQFDSDWSIKQQIAYNRVDEDAYIVAPFGLDDPRVVVRAPEHFHFPQTTYSTNVDITGHIDTFGALHTLLLGGDVYRTTGSNKSIIYFSTLSQVDVFNPKHPGLPFASPFSDFSYASTFTQNTHGLYVQDQVELPQNFFLLAGARYQYIRQEQASGFSDISTEPGPLKPNGDPIVARALTPRFGLLWRPREWVSFYGNYTEGFGPNTGMIFPGALAPPSNARSWEAGVKLEFFDGKLRATADYYDLTKTNVPTADALHPGFSLLIGEARSKGPEVDIQGEILPGWSMIAAYTNQDVRVTKADPSDTVLVPGQRYPSVPRNLASLWTMYEFQDETLKGLKIGGGYTYHGSQPVAGAASTYPLLPSYGTVDLVTAYGFKMAGTKLTAQVNVTNLFNRLYYADGSAFSPPTPGLQFPAGRSYGAPFAVLGSIRAEF